LGISTTPRMTLYRDVQSYGILILIYIQHDATLHSLFYLETALHNALHTE